MIEPAEDRGALEVAARRDPVPVAGDGTELRTEDGVDLLGRPDVEEPFVAVAVLVE